MTPTETHRYQSQRRQDVPARYAYAYAILGRTIPRHDWDERHGVWSTEYVDGPFTVSGRLESDDYTDRSWLGTLTDSYADGAILLPGRRHPYDPSSYKHDDREHSYDRHDGYRYFIPETSAREHYTDLRRTHGRSEAWRLANEYVQRDLALMTSDDSDAFMRVTVSAHGVELGHAAVGGITLDMDQFWRDPSLELDCLLSDLAPEALSEARDAIAAIGGMESAA